MAPLQASLILVGAVAVAALPVNTSVISKLSQRPPALLSRHVHPHAATGSRQAVASIGTNSSAAHLAKHVSGAGARALLRAAQPEQEPLHVAEHGEEEDIRGLGGAEPDGYADTDSEHPRRSPPEGDPVGDHEGWGPDAERRENSPAGEMPEHFSLLDLVLGPCPKGSCSPWTTRCTVGICVSLFLMLWMFKCLKVNY